MNRLEQTLDLGTAELFPLARKAILTWKLQESAGVIARPVRRVHVGQIIDLRLNPLWPWPPARLRGRDLTVCVGSCEVVEIIDIDALEATVGGARQAAGFVYRTLPGHLDSGEQQFLVSVGGNGRLGVSVTSKSVPGHPLLRDFAPVSVAAHRMMARRYVVGLKRMLGQSDPAG